MPLVVKFKVGMFYFGKNRLNILCLPAIFPTDTVSIYTVGIIVNAALLSCQPRVTATSRFVYKFIRVLESIDQLCNNTIRRIGFIPT